MLDDVVCIWHVCVLTTFDTVHTYMLYDLRMYKDITGESLYIADTYYVHTVYILSHNGLRRDEDIQAGGLVSTQPHITDDDEGVTIPAQRTKNFSRGDQMLTTWKRQ